MRHNLGHFTGHVWPMWSDVCIGLAYHKTNRMSVQGIAISTEVSKLHIHTFPSSYVFSESYNSNTTGVIQSLAPLKLCTGCLILKCVKVNGSEGKVSSFYHLCVKYFSQFSFDSELYTKSAAVADFVYISEPNERCEKHSTKRW